jgi:DNA-binding NarL/FixJ family response regulator
VTALAIKVLLADDGKIIRPAVARLLKEEPSVELVGEATSFGKTIKIAAALKPDILLMDLHMHDECEIPAADLNSQSHLLRESENRRVAVVVAHFVGNSPQIPMHGYSAMMSRHL